MHIPKVNGPLVSGALNDKAAPGVKEKSVESGSRGDSSADSVSLSSAATGLSRIEERVASSDGIDRQKIDEIKSALQRGDYPFDPEKIADKLIGMERLLG